MSVFEILKEYEVTKPDGTFRSFAGKIDFHFRTWLESTVGFYSDNVLVATDWGSTLIYQYDFELESLKSSYNNIYLRDVDNWSVIVYPNEILLKLKSGEDSWACFKLFNLYPVTC